MELRMASSPKDVKFYTTERLREEFHIPSLFIPGEIKMVYSHVDRVITGAAVPIEPICLASGEELKAEYFLQRREMGLINIGGPGKVLADGNDYELNYKDGLYLGMGVKNITFFSFDSTNPAKFYFLSTPAHKSYPSVLIHPEQCIQVELGSLEESNHRIITKYILPGQVESCQLVMGMTSLKPGSVWNTMPCHTHDRRMEVYLYFEMDEKSLVFHYMGEPKETRHIIIRNEEAVISPSWSIHAGAGTKAYTFIWGMAGENQDFDDMDKVSMDDLL
ncbi:MAG: 4-deoxy-L-threo-5-hexosulose-uronate ketol-isomerase [Herbinix sp.]|jgi:4-deoxy-L-threo-5-hexosulose-uronate ketol-isomerase|nr:4-deoxy-L-threo-5-hexosulose-uronate ketol-isomerase [Herbinix sp.]